jgi:hypothetical protein
MTSPNKTSKHWSVDYPTQHALLICALWRDGNWNNRWVTNRLITSRVRVISPKYPHATLKMAGDTESLFVTEGIQR